MKKILLILIISLSFGSISMADTIDFWHIYYNNVKIQECNIYSEYVMHLKLDSIKADDSITVRYFRDTPCVDCEAILHIQGVRNKRDFIYLGHGTFYSITFHLKPLIEHYNSTGDDNFNVYWRDDRGNLGEKAIPIFIIKLE